MKKPHDSCRSKVKYLVVMSHLGQLDEVDQIDQIDQIELQLPLGDVVQGLYDTYPSPGYAFYIMQVTRLPSGNVG